MTHSEGLRQYANWCDDWEFGSNPEVCVYSITTQEDVNSLWRALPSPMTDIKNSDQIGYIVQIFGPLKVKYVIKLEFLCDLTIENNRVVRVLKSQFQAVTA